jgi:NTE family protein
MKLKRLLGFYPKHIGIALRCGSTHGAAHIGVLKVLRQAGILPVIVTGTSAGAIVGAAYSAGVEIDEISRLFKNANWPKLARIVWKDALSVFST